MKIIAVDNKEEMSEKASGIIISLINQNPEAILGLATGATPIETYKLLIRDHKLNRTSYKNIQTFNLDEYVGLGNNHPNSYHNFMNEQLFKHIDVSKSQTHLPNGLATEPEHECVRYEQSIQLKGGIDLQLLGIGQNGHIGFNEPGTSFDSSTHIIKLAESTRIANAKYFTNIDEVPTHAITMGIKTIMKAKRIILLASGQKKACALSKVIYGKVTEEVPASILQRHPNVTIIADKEAYRDLDSGKFKHA